MLEQQEAALKDEVDRLREELNQANAALSEAATQVVAYEPQADVSRMMRSFVDELRSVRVDQSQQMEVTVNIDHNIQGWNQEGEEFASQPDEAEETPTSSQESAPTDVAAPSVATPETTT